MASSTDECKHLIIHYYRRAQSFFGRDAHDLLIATELLTTNVERLVKPIYIRLGRAGVIRPFLARPQEKDRCDAVAAALDHQDTFGGFVSAETFEFLRRARNDVKHDAYPKIEQIKEVLTVAQLMCAVLFRYEFGEQIPDEDDQDSFAAPRASEAVESTLRDLTFEDRNELIFGGIRRHIAPHLISKELELFDLLRDHLVYGVVDSATLRRARSFVGWSDIGRNSAIEFYERLMPATRSEAELILCSKALQVLADLKDFVKTEAWSVRVTMNVGRDDPRSDAELAFLSVVKHILSWSADDNEAA